MPPLLVLQLQLQLLLLLLLLTQTLLSIPRQFPTLTSLTRIASMLARMLCIASMLAVWLCRCCLHCLWWRRNHHAEPSSESSSDSIPDHDDVEGRQFQGELGGVLRGLHSPHGHTSHAMQQSWHRIAILAIPQRVPLMSPADSLWRCRLPPIRPHFPASTKFSLPQSGPAYECSAAHECSAGCLAPCSPGDPTFWRFRSAPRNREHFPIPTKTGLPRPILLLLKCPWWSIDRPRVFALFAVLPRPGRPRRGRLPRRPASEARKRPPR